MVPADVDVGSAVGDYFWALLVEYHYVFGFGFEYGDDDDGYVESKVVECFEDRDQVSAAHAFVKMDDEAFDTLSCYAIIYILLVLKLCEMLLKPRYHFLRLNKKRLCLGIDINVLTNVKLNVFQYFILS